MKKLLLATVTAGIVVACAACSGPSPRASRAKPREAAKPRKVVEPRIEPAAPAETKEAAAPVEPKGAAAPAAPAPAAVEKPTDKVELFNGRDLAGWEFHLKGDADPAGTFKVEGGVVRCSGGPAGYMRTGRDYENYKLTVEWRFLEPGNSGVLVHMSGPDKVWPRSVECQGMHGSQGDFFVIGGTEFKEHRGKEGRRVAKKGPSNEMPLGDWNVYEIYCRGDAIRPYVNGRLMNEATECNVTSGKICIQSEGAAWECRRITLEPVPDEEPAAGGEIALFNGKDFTGWEFCLGGDADPAKTFSVEDGLIKCTGKPGGYMRTIDDYENYKFTMEWRFLKPGNGGVLVHMSEPDRVWPRSIECQGWNGNQGDFFVIGGTEFKEHMGQGGRRVPKKGPANENPIGEWNVYEIVCRGDTVKPYVNGKLMNEATECNVTGGKICIQSEGAVWECRKITLGPVPPQEMFGGSSGVVMPGPPSILPRTQMVTAETDIQIKTSIRRAEIRYTLDGSEPDEDSKLYKAPFRVDRSTTVKAKAYAPDGWKSAVATRHFKLMPPAPPAPDVYISDIKAVKFQSGWGGAPKINLSIENNPLRLGGKRYKKGIGTHAHSEISYALEPRYKRFVAVVGRDQEIGNGTIVFKVYADDKLLDESPVMRADGFWHIDVAIPPGAKLLRLIVADAGDGVGCDHGDWVDAGFVTGGE